MKNVKIKVEKKKLFIEVDLTQTLGPSKSGKTIVIGTTNGAETIKFEGKDVFVNLNVYKK